ncbi:TonB-dependent receptor plug domain-containing protein [Puniceicoccaceae bacterium K14]|nr:TonB-dependent receptor plug domain-containing protein [Puniceicoccaceae bacterium K14]
MMKIKNRSVAERSVASCFSKLVPLTISGALLVGAPLALSQELDDDDEVFELSPFEVDASEDVGWRSTNSTSGTSLNTKLKDLPMSIEVINSDFLDDTGATDFEEALQYSAGVVLDDQLADSGGNSSNANEVNSNERSASSRGGLGSRFSNATNIRGFNSTFQNRDGFRYGGSIATYGVQFGGVQDTVNLSRLEVVRGPNSLLYGIGVLSGIVNMLPKKPLSEPAGSASIAIGGYDYYRATFDWSAPLSRDLLGGQLNYRVAGSKTHEGSWIDFQESDKDYFVGQLEFKSDALSIFLELQHVEKEDTGTGPQFIYDNIGDAVDFEHLNPYDEQFNYQRDHGGLPQSYNIGGPDPYALHEESNALFNIDWKPNERFTLSTGAFFTKVDQEFLTLDVNGYNNTDDSVLQPRGYVDAIASGTATPESVAILQSFIDQFVNVHETPLSIIAEESGDDRDFQDYKSVAAFWSLRPMNSTTQQFRLRGSYNFQSKDFFSDSDATHNFVAGVGYIKDEADFVTGNVESSRLFDNDLGPDQLFNTEDALIVRNPYDHSIFSFEEGTALSIPGEVARNVEVWYKNAYALYSGRLMNDKLGIIAGLRYDQYHSRDREYDRFDEFQFVSDELPYGPDYTGPTTLDAPAGFYWNNPNNNFFGFLPDTTGQGEYRPGPEPSSETNATLALNYALTDSLTVFALSSGGVTPNIGLVDGLNQAIDSEKTDSKELGIKFELFNRRLSGSVSIYEIQRENAVYQINSAPAPWRWFGSGTWPFGEDEPTDSGTFSPVQYLIDDNFEMVYGVHSNVFLSEGIELGELKEPDTIDPVTGERIRGSLEPPEGVKAIIQQGYYLTYEGLDLNVVDKDGVVHEDFTYRMFLEKAFADTAREIEGFSQFLSTDERYQPYNVRRSQTADYAYSTSVATNANVTYTDQAQGLDIQLVYQVNDNWQLTFNYAHTERKAITPFQFVPVDYTDENGVVHSFGTEYDSWVRTFGREAFGLQEVYLYDDETGEQLFDSNGNPWVVGVVDADGNELNVGDVRPDALLTNGAEVSTYLGSEDTASIFQKYSFLEGKLKGLELNMGTSYIGPAATSVPIGGPGLLENLYQTPETKERYIVNAGITYKWRTEKRNYDFRLTVSNLLDDQKGETTASYDVFDPDGTFNRTELRRTVKYYAPRSFRFTVSTTF